MSETVKVEQPNLVAFVAKIEELVKQGYKVSGTNSGVPSTWGPGLYTCEMIADATPKQEPKQVEEKQEAPATTEYSGPKKTTTRRKSKSKTSE